MGGDPIHTSARGRQAALGYGSVSTHYGMSVVLCVRNVINLLRDLRARANRNQRSAGRSPSRARSIMSRASAGTSTPYSSNRRSTHLPICRGSR